MKSILTILCILLISTIAYTQSLNVEPYHGKTDSLNKWPTYPGGDEERERFLSTNLEYPEAALEELIEGKVVVGFNVEKDGSITDVHILKGIDPWLDDEALRVVKLMPKWNPGLVGGKPVRTKHKLTVQYQIPNSYKNRRRMLEYNNR